MALPPFGAPRPSAFPSTPGPNPADLANGVPIAFQSAPLGTSVNFTPGRRDATGEWMALRISAGPGANFSVKLNHNYFGFFIQDQWRPRQN
jgi:hypothetical protein